MQNEILRKLIKNQDRKRKRGSKKQRMFLILSIEAEMFLFFCQTEARHVLRMFLIFKKFEPQRSYKHGSYSRKSVYSRVNTTGFSSPDPLSCAQGI